MKLAAEALEDLQKLKAPAGRTNDLPPASQSQFLNGDNMNTITKNFSYTALLLIAATLCAPVAALAADHAALERDARASYQELIATVSVAKSLSKDAIAVLVFPKITKAGLVVGGQYGEGVLFKEGKIAGYYKTTGASYGLQAGAQRYGYALFLMNEKAVNALHENDGFELGIGPSVVVVDKGMGKSVSTTTATNDIYAFIFGQKGLMAGIGVQGNKVTQLAE